jgi:glucosamine--fructose-6-phosphate aminotransferase (isomerizing)
MCGIVGAIAQRNVVPILLQGLQRLEYRGYDSAGLVVVNNHKLERARSTGRVADLTQRSADIHAGQPMVCRVSEMLTRI